MTVNVDTRGITKEMEGKKLRITFSDGETAEIKLDCVMTYDCHEDCNGFVYTVLATNQNEKYHRPFGEDAFWGRFEDVVSIAQLTD